MALACTYGYTAIISPLTITYLLLFVSGIPMTEKQFENNPEFQRYKQTTNALIPWFKK
jgi:steroid 5-alpha reductase family enzyme